MAPATRRKRPADADADPAPVPAKQARKTRGQTAIEAKAESESIGDADHDQTSEPEVKKPAARKGRSKATAKAEPVDDEEADVAEPTKAKAAPKKGRSKAKADPTKDEQADEAESEKTKTVAPKKGRGKSKVKEEPAEDENADDAEATKPAPKKGRGKAKVKEELAEDEQADDVKPKKETKAATTTDFKEAQVAKAGTSHIPLDDGCHLTSYHVYVDPNDQLIYDASLNQTNAGHNNNKFYRVQVSSVPLRSCWIRLLTLYDSCSRMEPTTRPGLAGDASESGGRAQCLEVVLSMMLSGTSRRSSKTNQV
jgi:hypothetical protein